MPIREKSRFGNETIKDTEDTVFLGKLNGEDSFRPLFSLSLSKMSINVALRTKTLRHDESKLLLRRKKIHVQAQTSMNFRVFFVLETRNASWLSVDF